MNVPTEFINAIIWAFVGVLVWIWNQKTKAYDMHLKECNERRQKDAVTDATVAERICNIERNSNKNRGEIAWLGDCIINLGAKLNVQLPDRPE